jgi:hypothetical protein
MSGAKGGDMIDWLERISDLFPSVPWTASEPESALQIGRRFTLGLPALLAASFLLARGREAAAASLSFEEVTKQIVELAKPMIQDTNRNEEEYLFRVASLVSTLKEFPVPQFGEPFRKVMWSAMSYRGSGIAVIQWKMEPGAVYQAHNHPGYSAISIGIRGECRMRNFDYVGAPPFVSSKERFLVRETQDTVLRPGHVTSIMSTTRDNIHELHAGKDGIVAADIITKVGPDQEFGFINIETRPRDQQQRVYEAAWAESQPV